MNEYVISQTNKQWIVQMTDQILKTLSTHHTLQKLDSGAFSTISLGESVLTVSQYTIDTIGNLLLLTSTESDAFQILTAVITPYSKALPLFSTDVMFNKDKRTYILDFYDLVEKKEPFYYSYLKQFKEVIATYDSLTDMPMKRCWYDSLKTVHTAKSTDMESDDMLSSLTITLLSRYLEMEANSPLLSKEERDKKWSITKDYVDHLIHKGGVSTDLFKSVLGPKKTTAFFYSVFFGLDWNKDH